MIATENVGRHIIVELWDCDNLDSEEIVRQSLEKAVEASGATLLGLEVHKFEPHGVTGVAILSESHISIHTWPEHNYAAVDIFTCGERVNPEKAIDALKDFYSPGNVQLVEIRRGVLRG